MIRKKLLYILNTKAGHGQVEDVLADVLDIMVKADYEVRVHTTQGTGDALDIIKCEGADYDRIICSGGDGTFDEVVAGVLSLDKRIPIGYIPSGSTNDFAYSLGLPRDDMLRAAKIAIGNASFVCDIGSFNNRPFVYVAAFGLFTAASYSTPQNLKNAFGHAAYLFQGAKELVDIRAYNATIEYDGNVISGEYVIGMITNSSSIGGFTGILGKDISLNDGMFEVTLIRKPRNLLEMNEILPALFDVALLPGLKSDIVERLKVSSLVITTDEQLPWTLDGEFGGEITRAEIVNLHDAVEIMVEEQEEAK